ncbi:MAG: hypothetical protein MJ054_02530, partial [Clostridia bacterium]|nr:hypothetical protein [Clostridia bacterium]
MRKVKLKDLLYKMQIAGYQNQAYWQLVPKLTQGMVKNTARVKRLRLVTKTLCILGVGFPLFCLPRTLAFANYLMQPWEKLIQNYWLKRAKRILRQYPNLIKIGITGSYGKTSVKNILAELLGTKYRVVASPASFNTPMGFARTVNQFL